MDLKLEFITRLRQGERMTDLCVEYGISRKTGHKLKSRYEALGAAGLHEQSRAPKYIPHKTTPELAALVVAERHKHPTWGPRKLKVVLERKLGRELPSGTTLGKVLAQAGLVNRRKVRTRHKAMGTRLRVPRGPNDLWCIDYKGQFRLGDGSYCYPLTVTDQYSRYLLGCEGMAAISDEAARATCEELFCKHGLPTAIRSDNGAPFASTGLAGLTKLSAYWLQLGICLERIRPAHPEENGAHERMHLTLKRETTRPARSNLLQQQERFDEFGDEYNHERPHEALAMRRPAEVYAPSTRPYPSKLPEPAYPLHDDVLLVGTKGHVTLTRHRQAYLATALAGQHVGIREEDDGRLLVSFLDIDLGHFTPDRTFVPHSSTPPEAH